MRYEGGAWQGKGDYPLTTLGTILEPGQGSNFEMRWKNVSGATKTIRGANAILKDPGFSFRYFVDGVNVTKQLRDGSLVFSGIAAGKKTPIVLVNARNKTAEIGTAQQRLFGRYGGGGGACDELKVLVNHS